MQQANGSGRAAADDPSSADDGRHLEERLDREDGESPAHGRGLAGDGTGPGDLPHGVSGNREEVDEGQRGPADWHRYSRPEGGEGDDGTGSGSVVPGGGPSRRGYLRRGAYRDDPGRYGGYGGLREPVRGPSPAAPSSDTAAGRDAPGTEAPPGATPPPDE